MSAKTGKYVKLISTTISSRYFAIFLFLISFNFSFSQQNQVISNIIRGSVVGLGWGAGVSNDTVLGQVYFDCSTCAEIGNVYVLAIESKTHDSISSIPINFKINNNSLTFNSESIITSRFGPWPFVNNKFVYYLHFLSFDFQCNSLGLVDFRILPKDFKNNVLALYMIVECLDNSSDLTAYSIVLNTGDTDVNLQIPASESVDLIPHDNSKDVGFAMVGSVMNFMNGDGSNVSFNGQFLGKIGGIDSSSFPYYGTGVRGHFRYSNGILEGLDDDTPDLIMDSTDALANIKSLMNASNDFYFSCVHELPNTSYAYYTNPVTAGILTYSTFCDTFPVTVPRDTTLCYGAQLSLNVSGGVAYEWFPTTGLSCTNCPNPVFTADTSVFYTVKIWNNDSCFVSKPLKINVLPKTEFENIVITPSECGSNTGKVSFPNMQNIVSYTLVGGATTSLNYFDALSSGFYTFRVLHKNGCYSTDTTVFVPEINSTEVSFFATPLSGPPPLEVNLQNTSFNATNFEWYLNNEFIGSNVSSILLSETGNYLVELIGWDTAIGCSDTAYQSIFVYDSLIISLPNVFTPNGDGIHDVFSISVNLPVHSELSIFNRWGSEVYRYDDNLPVGKTDLWNGEGFLDGVYFYKIKTHCTKPNSFCELTQEGFITILR